MRNIKQLCMQVRALDHSSQFPVFQAPRIREIRLILRRQRGQHDVGGSRARSAVGNQHIAPRTLWLTFTPLPRSSYPVHSNLQLLQWCINSLTQWHSCRGLRARHGGQRHQLPRHARAHAAYDAG